MTNAERGRTNQLPMNGGRGLVAKIKKDLGLD